MLNDLYELYGPNLTKDEIVQSLSDKKEIIDKAMTIVKSTPIAEQRFLYDLCRVVSDSLGFDLIPPRKI